MQHQKLLRGRAPSPQAVQSTKSVLRRPGISAHSCLNKLASNYHFLSLGVMRGPKPPRARPRTHSMSQRTLVGNLSRNDALTDPRDLWPATFQINPAYSLECPCKHSTRRGVDTRPALAALPVGWLHPEHLHYVLDSDSRRRQLRPLRTGGLRTRRRANVTPHCLKGGEGG